MFAKKLSVICSVIAMMAVLPHCDSFAAAKKSASKQSAIQTGTKVRTKVEVSGLYDQECYDAYYGCMDSFCIADNESGGSCTCSDVNAEYEKELLEIKGVLDEAERIRTVEVEKVQAGANADIIFGDGKREYDEDGNIVDLDKKAKKDDLLSLWDTSFEEEEEEEIDISELTGNALYDAAQELCQEQIPEKCDKDFAFLTQVYKRQITSDCKGFQNSITQKRAEADAALASAEADVRSALKDSLNAANKYDLGTCMVEFKKCMMTEDACGKDWMGCVSTIANANMQGINESSVFDEANMKKSAQKAFDGSAYGIAASTMEGLDSKRIICERVLNQCVAVRDQVWPAFLRESAPTIKVAELNAESKIRQSCLTNISNCIQKACKDDIVGKGVDTMDACLSRPDMARSFCKVELEPCEKMEPQIWSYVTDKLAAMRVDACTEEVKACFTDENRCGKNFENCIGMDYEYIHDICPIDTLVVCKQGNPNFSMSDLDSMLMGLYLNVDNSALDNCQALVDAKMTEVCGSLTDCNRFASDEVIGTNSLRSVKDGTTFRVTGMISFGSIKMGDATGVKDGKTTLGPGEIGVADYIEQIKEKNKNVKNADAVIATIEDELNNIAGTINRTIAMIEQDPEIQYCVAGRSLKNITGNDEMTEARFPNLLNSIKTMIAVSALRQAQDNYNKKFTEEVAKATADASLDIAQYMCQKAAQQGATDIMTPQTDLIENYAISYDVGTGLNQKDLTTGGSKITDLGGVKFSNAGYLGNKDSTTDLSAGQKETTAIFSRETRICRICTTTFTQSCKTKGSKSWFHNNRNIECETATPTENCQDIQM